MRAIVVHGGAGRETPDGRSARRAGVLRAVDAGWRVLANGGAALDAVVNAVVVLEDDPYFNAGVGSILNDAGEVEMDASLMEGAALRAGAVGALRGVPNPIRVARAILEEGREVLVVGDAARVAAERHGLPTCDPGALVTAEARRRWQARDPAPGETVGAVACDAAGHVAAATSTGGVSGKRAGRVGDSAVIGAGTYADDAFGAGSATGPGEAIIRLTLVRTALERVAHGVEPARAAAETLAALARRLGVEAGLILLDATGRIAVAHTTPTMPAAHRSDAAPQTIVVE
jgi:L-asparaginase / beta-aspartyl-peptidase